jgi:hypothetical protein
MKSLKDYLAEAEFIMENPVPGDYFDIEVDTDTLIETVVTEINDRGDVMIALDEHAIGLLTKAGYIFESGTTPETEDDTEGFMSPISGLAFIPYSRKQDPRNWMRNDVEHADDAGKDVVTMSGVPADKRKVGPGVPQNSFNKQAGPIQDIKEAEYRGHKVQLGKKMAGDVKKSKVYVRKPNGNIVKVNFGDKKMRIKKSNPKRRKSFRARHHCENPGPRWKARYWSCRSW